MVEKSRRSAVGDAENDQRLLEENIELRAEVALLRATLDTFKTHLNIKTQENEKLIDLGQKDDVPCRCLSR
jgi:hypothetical protein